jgi:hypothetical protein
MAAQPGKGKVQKSLKYGVNLLDSDEEGNSSEPESSESDDNTPDTTATAPAAGAGAPAKKAAKAKGKKKPKTVAAAGGVIAGGRKAKRKAAANVAALNFGPSLSAKKAKAAAANPARDKAVDKALAQQATSIPKIDDKIIQQLLTKPAYAFSLFESKLVNLDLRLWMKALSDVLPAGAILPAQVLAITEGPNAADQKAQYQELKDLVMKTYTTADAPIEARDALFGISMDPQIGPISLAIIGKNAYLLCKQFSACDVSAISLFRAFTDNIPSIVRQELFRTVTLTEMASQIRTYKEDDLSWFDPIVHRCQDIWSNYVESGTLSATKSDLSSLSAKKAESQTAALPTEITSAIKSAVKAGLAAADINTSTPGSGKKKKGAQKYRGNMSEFIKSVEDKMTADDLAARRALIESGKRIVNKDGPKGSCTHDHLFENDYIEIPDTRKKQNGKNRTRKLRVCVRCHKTGHSASRCTESGPAKDCK